MKDIRDDQIRVIGGDDETKKTKTKLWVIIGVAVAMLIAVIAIVATLSSDGGDTSSDTACDEQQITEEKHIETEFETSEVAPAVQEEVVEKFGMKVDSLASGFTEIQDTVINDIPMRIYIPHNADMSLHIGKMNKGDESIIFTAQAADVRADNGGIVGAFVLNGEPKAWGLSKRGYCASIDGVVTVGVADNSPLFEQATERGGHFFRQYPLVDNGVLVENELRGKSIRRAICDRYGEIFIVESGTTESFHDFAQALVDLGVDNAIYIVGGSAYGWAVDADGECHEFGEDNYYTGRRKMPKNTSYLVWRKK